MKYLKSKYGNHGKYGMFPETEEDKVICEKSSSAIGV